MTQEIRPDQVALIYSLESFCKVTGAKRFKRTKEEMALGLSPEEALKRRLGMAEGLSSETYAAVQTGLQQARDGQGTSGPPQFSGCFTISVVPEVGVDPDYFEHMKTQNLNVRLDGHWFKWYDELLKNKYDGDEARLIKDILDQGIGVVLTPHHV